MAIEQELKKTNPLYKEFQTLLDKEFSNKNLKENQIIKATVTEINNKFIICDAGGKSEAHISVDEFKQNDELSKLKKGDIIECYLERLEHARSGEMVLSRSKAIQMEGWKHILSAHESQEVCKGVLQNRIKGGYTVLVKFKNSNFLCFMPSSQLALAPMKKADHLFNTEISVKILKADKSRGNAICSRREVLSASKNAETAEALKQIKEGDIVEARVHACVDWGIFLTYKSLTLLLHVSDCSHGRVKKPSDLASVGDTMTVKITKIDPKTNRVSASVKALTEDPYENIEQKYKIGEVYEGTVVKLMEYGAFVRIEDSVEGLIHNSMLDWKNRNIKPSKVLSVSQKIRFKVVSIDKNSKRISLSYKDTLDNPWDIVKNQIGKEVKIKINNVTDKAIFGELTDSGLTGMCHFRELSFSEDINELKKYKKNDIINVQIIDAQDEKIRFSKRALDKDPLDWFKDNKKKVGDIITTRIHEVLKTGVKVSLDKDKKLIVTIRKADLAKESADQRPEIFSPGNLLDSKLVELNLKTRKIQLSVKAAMLDEEKSLIAKFGEGATKSGATLKGIFEKALGNKKKKKKEEK